MQRFIEKQEVELYAKDLWEYLIEEDDDIIIKAISTSRLGIPGRLNIIMTEKHYNYYLTSLNILTFLKPTIKDEVGALYLIADYAIKNRKIDHKLLTVRGNQVVKEEFINAI